MISGGSLTCIAYTRDGNGSYLLAASGCVVRLYSTATGAHVRRLEGHSAPVTSVSHSLGRLHQSDVMQALSSSLDGRLIVWDLDEATALRTFCIGLPIVSMALHETQPDSAFVLTGMAPEAGSAAAIAAAVPNYCRDLAGAGRVYAVELTPSESLSAWADAHMAKANAAA